MSEKKYYWLKLKRDFFKRHDMQIIEATHYLTIKQNQPLSEK